MSIQWTMIAVCMYTELIIAVLLLLPFISPRRWHSFFKSRFLSSIGQMSHIYFKIFLAILVMVFLDSIREMYKFSTNLKEHSHGSEHSTHLDVEMQQHMRLFRAQRNFYISGFSLVLCFILQRLTSLISRLAISELECEAAMKQAKSASAAAQQLMTDSSGGKEVSDANAANEVKELKDLNKKMMAEKEAALKQAESVGREYDRLMEEHAQLQQQAGQSGDKKDD